MRNHSLDSAKLLAAFCIVVVHSGGFPEIGVFYGGLLENITRWALPFFFLVSGYTLGFKDNPDIMKRVDKLISILFWVSLIYTPLVFIKSIMLGTNFIESTVNLNVFYGGVYFHLWFMVSLILGLIISNFLIKNASVFFGVALSLTIMTLCWFTDALRSFGIGNDEFYLFRTLSGFSFVYLGCVFSIKDIPFRISHFGCWLIISLGFVLIVSESVLLNLFLMSNMHERQLPFGSVIVAIGILFHCVKMSSSASSMSHLGERYSLGVFFVAPIHTNDYFGAI